LTHKHKHTQPVGLLAEAATYTKHKEEKRRTLETSAGFEIEVPAIKRLQLLDSTAIGIGIGFTFTLCDPNNNNNNNK
jgi:hypothetical protein